MVGDPNTRRDRGGDGKTKWQASIENPEFPNFHTFGPHLSNCSPGRTGPSLRHPKEFYVNMFYFGLQKLLVISDVKIARQIVDPRVDPIPQGKISKDRSHQAPKRELAAGRRFEFEPEEFELLDTNPGKIGQRQDCPGGGHEVAAVFSRAVVEDRGSFVRHPTIGLQPMSVCQ